MERGDVVKINSDRAPAARFNGMKGEVVREVGRSDPAFNDQIEGQEQVVVSIEGSDVYFFANELEQSEVKEGERRPGDRRIDQTSPGNLATPTPNTPTGAPPVGELPRGPDGNVPNEVAPRVLQPEPTAPNPETGTLRQGFARPSEDNPPPDGMPRHAPVRPGAESGPTAEERRRFEEWKADEDRKQREGGVNRGR